MISVKHSRDSLQDIQNLFLHHARVFYSRFGDGDVYIMMGKDQANHRVSPALTSEMIESFAIDDPLYRKALAVNHPVEKGMVRGLFARFRDNPEMEDFLYHQFGALDHVTFENPVFLHYLAVFEPRLVNSFLNTVIRPRKKMFIGSIPREKIEALIGPVACFVETPPRNAYATIDSWYPQIEQHLHEVELIIPAAGMATRVINKRVWDSGAVVQSFDIGSLVDVADDRLTRKWIRLAGHRIERHILHPDRAMTASQALAYFKKEVYLTAYSAVKSVT